MDYVNSWNAVNEETKLGLNAFADLSNEEYRRIYLHPLPKRSSSLSSLSSRSSRSSLPRDAPPYATVDWRTVNAVTPIKNAGQCGSSWAFATTGAVEGFHAITTGTKAVSLSEQNLIDCTYSYGNYGCSGGDPQLAFEYIAQYGIDTEEEYPYQGIDGLPCRYNPIFVGATISGYEDVTTGDENALLLAVSQQPMAAGVDASHMSYQLYNQGVYYEPQCSSTNLDHGVTIVGYGTSGNTDYWLVKNQWGTTWGMDGYIWMARGRQNNCGIATDASYPI